MEYKESQLPVVIRENEYLLLDDGTTVRFEEASGARDIMIGEDFTPRCTLFPGNTYTFSSGGHTYLCTAGDWDLKVERG